MVPRTLRVKPLRNSHLAAANNDVVDGDEDQPELRKAGWKRGFALSRCYDDSRHL